MAHRNARLTVARRPSKFMPAKSGSKQAVGIWAAVKFDSKRGPMHQ